MKKLLRIVAVAGVSMIALNASAETFNRDAKVEVVRPAIVLENGAEDLDFGKILKPVGPGDYFITIDQDGVITQDEDNIHLPSQTFGGEYVFTGGADNVSVAVQANGNHPLGIELTSFTGQYGDDALTPGNPATLVGGVGPAGGTTLNVGGTLRVDNSAPAGQQTAGYTITISYQ